MHLTNYAINKSATNYVSNKASENDDQGHKRSLTFALKYMEQMGHNSSKVLSDIKAVIIKTICTVQPTLANTYRYCQPEDLTNAMCFEILGFDIFLDASLRPWVIEVNHAPSFTTDSPLDFKIKKSLITDTIALLNLSNSKKQKFKKQKEIEYQRRALTKGPNTKITQKDINLRKAQQQKKRSKYEAKHCGNYELIFPSEEFKVEDY